MSRILKVALGAAVAASVALPPLAGSYGAAPAGAAGIWPAAVDSPDVAGTGRVTWAVQPGGTDGPDGRAWVEWEADPGQQRDEYLVVSNFGAADVEFRLAAADGYFTDTGRFNMLPSDRESSDAGTWIDLPETVAVAAGGQTVIPFTISVPRDATPGDHPAGVAASIVTPGSATVGVESRVGFRVMTRVTGELDTAITAGVHGGYAGSMNPFEAGSLVISYDITNSGNTRLKTRPVVHISGPFGIGVAQLDGEEIAEIAPGETRAGTVTVPRTWPLGWYDVRVVATPDSVTDDLGAVEGEAAQASVTVVAIPWSQAVVVMIALLLLLWYLLQRRHDRRRLERLVSEAREEGRAEAGEERRGEAPDRSGTQGADAALPSRRDTRRARAHTWGVIVAAWLAVGALAAPGDSARAEPPDNGAGVEVSVEITPAPHPTPTPTSPATPEPTAPGVTPPSPGGVLATTGAPDPTVPLAVGGLLLLLGTATAVVRRRLRPTATESHTPLRR